MSLDLYRNLWFGEPVAFRSDATFIAYDCAEILSGPLAIEAHWARRRSHRILISADFTPYLTQAEEDLVIGFGKLHLTTQSVAGVQPELQQLRFVSITQRGPMGTLLIHIAEAADAAILAMIAGYQQEARIGAAG